MPLRQRVLHPSLSMMHSAKYKKRRAFTLLELLVAITLLSVVMSLAFQGFNRTLMGWKRGTQLIEDMRYGDHFMQEVSQAFTPCSSLMIEINPTPFVWKTRLKMAFRLIMSVL